MAQHTLESKMQTGNAVSGYQKIISNTKTLEEKTCEYFLMVFQLITIFLCKNKFYAVFLFGNRRSMTLSSHYISSIQHGVHINPYDHDFLFCFLKQYYRQWKNKAPPDYFKNGFRNFI